MSQIPKLILEPIAQLKIAKLVSPSIFENATPKMHLEILAWLNNPTRRKAAVLFRGAGKSTLLNKIHCFNRVFLKHEPFILIISENKTKAQSFLKDIKRMIDRATTLGLDIVRGEVWNEHTIEIITGGVMCQITALGVEQDPRGYVSDNRRPTFIIIDDFESRKNMKNAEQRQKLKDYFYQDLEPCLHPDGEILIVGTIMHEDQFLNDCLKNKKYWDSTVYSCFDESGKSRWQSRFTKQRLNEIKTNLESIGDFTTFPNEYLCIAQSPEKQLFKREYFKYFEKVVFDDGAGYTKTLSNAIDNATIAIKKPTHIKLIDGTLIPIEELYITATMDLASTGKDHTVIFIRGIDKYNRKYNLEIIRGHFNPFEKACEAIKAQLTWQPVFFGIEKASMQNDFFYTIDEAKKAFNVNINVLPLLHGNVPKNIRISKLQPSYALGQIYHNLDDFNNMYLEAQLCAFQMDIEGVDDIIDANAYQEQFSLNRDFSGNIEDDEYNTSVWFDDD